MNQLDFTALGTQWHIECSRRISPDIRSWLTKFEQTYSRFIQTSFLNHISQTPGVYTLDQDGQNILELYIKINSLTNNLFTPTIGQNLSEAGYDINYSLKSNQLSKLASLNRYLELKGNQLTIKTPIQLDFGGVGKGYAIDKVTSILTNDQKLKASDYVYINAGGDIYIKSSTPEEVALEHPDDSTQAIGTISIQNQSICGSAGNRRRWREYHHIINPKTQTSPQSIKSVWVVAPTATIADSLATCLFLVEPSVLIPHFAFDYLILDNNNMVTKSDNFHATLFTTSR